MPVQNELFSGAIIAQDTVNHKEEMLQGKISGKQILGNDAGVFAGSIKHSSHTVSQC